MRDNLLLYPPRSSGAKVGIPSARLELAMVSFKQNRAMCGPACLKIVFAFFGVRLSENEIAEACRSRLDSGTSGANLIRGAKKFGFTGRVFDRSSFRSIATWLRRGVPVIVDWMSTVPAGRHAMACGHYSVVSGLEKDHIVLQDPGIGGRRR